MSSMTDPMSTRSNDTLQVIESQVSNSSSLLEIRVQPLPYFPLLQKTILLLVNQKLQPVRQKLQRKPPLLLHSMKKIKTPSNFQKTKQPMDIRFKTMGS